MWYWVVMAVLVIGCIALLSGTFFSINGFPRLFHALCNQIYTKIHAKSKKNPSTGGV